ncbi:hypothetical protein LCGC14_2216330 [marine sediment metagenome]|uniref:Uncharacterized protein n=1 Tax=marine sediment metagenome TaxID=412755 RepID=A0A0F9DZS5_9ZZZZ
MENKYLADNEFCISLNKLRLVVVVDGVPMHNDPNHSMTLIYEDTKEPITISYTDKDKRDAMYKWIICGTKATEILKKEISE